MICGRLQGTSGTFLEDGAILSNCVEDASEAKAPKAPRTPLRAHPKTHMFVDTGF